MLIRKLPIFDRVDPQVCVVLAELACIIYILPGVVERFLEDTCRLMSVSVPVPELVSVSVVSLSVFRHYVFTHILPLHIYTYAN